MNDTEEKEVKFQCHKNKKVRNRPQVFMAKESDAIEWEEIGIGFIVGKTKDESLENEDSQDKKEPGKPKK